MMTDLTDLPLDLATPDGGGDPSRTFGDVRFNFLRWGCRRLT